MLFLCKNSLLLTGHRVVFVLLTKTAVLVNRLCWSGLPCRGRSQGGSEVDLVTLSHCQNLVKVERC